jgi:hypothetical protein
VSKKTNVLLCCIVSRDYQIPSTSFEKLAIFLDQKQFLYAGSILQLYKLTYSNGDQAHDIFNEHCTSFHQLVDSFHTCGNRN